MAQYIIAFLVGVIFASLIAGMRDSFRYFGTFEIDPTKDDKTIFRLNWKKDPIGAARQRYIIFDVYKTSLTSLDELNFPSQKNKTS